MHEVLGGLSRKANLAIINFRLLIIISCLSLLFLLWQAMHMEFAMNGDYVLLLMCNGFVAIAYLMAGGFFMIWFFAAYRHLYIQSPETLRYAPIWTVLGFSLPIANLFLPYVLVVNVWRRLMVKSNVDASDTQWRAPRYFTFWWVSHLSVFFCIPAIYFVVAIISDNSDLLLMQFVLSGLGYVLICNTARFAIRLVSEINSLQG
jgi:hypothetical protein